MRSCRMVEEERIPYRVCVYKRAINKNEIRSRLWFITAEKRAPSVIPHNTAQFNKLKIYYKQKILLLYDFDRGLRLFLYLFRIVNKRWTAKDENIFKLIFVRRYVSKFWDVFSACRLYFNTIRFRFRTCESEVCSIGWVVYRLRRRILYIDV